MPGLRTHHSRLRALATVVTAAALATLVPASGPAAAEHGGGAVAGAAAGCASADADPHAAAYTRVHDATLCLLNAERRERGLKALRHNGRLATAAGRHARDMVRRRYFAHDAPGGVDFVDRIVRAGYVRRSQPGWVLGENLAWGSGDLATPRQIMRAWMDSPGHRRNILNPRFREIGVALTRDVPVRGASAGATYVTEFGAR